MIYIEQNEEITDQFMVIDKHDVSVTGLIKSDFTIKLYNPNGDDVADISGGVAITVEEVGDGVYRISFTPDTLGAWSLLIYHATHFEDGQGENYTCVENLGGGVTQDIEDMIIRILGLSQENSRIYDQVYDKYLNLTGAKIRIYPSATDVDNDTNHIAEYVMEAVWDRKRRLTGYKYKRVT